MRSPTAGVTSVAVTETDADKIDAKVSPRGNFVSWVRDQDLVVYDLSTTTETAITSDGDGHPALIRNLELVSECR